MPETLNAAQLDAYLARIGFAGTPRADLATLTALHRAHVLAIPFENLDVQFGRPSGLAIGAAFAKLVRARRGGWCYEHNGLLGAALASLGFEVTRLSGGVMRAVRGEASMGSHLALKVRLDGQDWLADVGFGSSQIEPLPLAEALWHQAPMSGRLALTEDGLWQLAIESGPAPLSYDFVDRAADESELARLCTWQASDPGSVFVQNLVVQQRLPEGHLMLRGKVLTETLPGERRVRELGSAGELVTVLLDRFGLDVPEAADLWPQICARHEALFAAP